MMLVAAFLFGSRARCDHKASSDIDILIVTKESSHDHANFGNLSITIISHSDLEVQAKRGDLFVWHIVAEATPLYDPNDYLPDLRSKFILRSDYDDVVSHASELAWYLIRFGKRLGDERLANRRVAWCIRTILIARSAERGLPAFSASALAAFAGDAEIASVINRKGDRWLARETLEGLKYFIEKFGRPEPLPWPCPESKYIAMFVDHGNKVALGTLRSARGNLILYE
ncbi:nucleotidyltransferase domain-containing protein [Inquilinus sp. Marseille-Q2685]|uniref:nucleotidyltransferase domain-containing protein n=1 Tax=Inquilinus sp. Marseille-Q2685 TaxID=2866581 RepID=UPI001CE45254|nr:nucleotidyltransferase domain-containing protein [Inquilinus sp. Marseille-Q2685]